MAKAISRPTDQVKLETSPNPEKGRRARDAPLGGKLFSKTIEEAVTLNAQGTIDAHNKRNKRKLARGKVFFAPCDELAGAALRTCWPLHGNNFWSPRITIRMSTSARIAISLGVTAWA